MQIGGLLTLIFLLLLTGKEYYFLIKIHYLTKY